MNQIVQYIPEAFSLFSLTIFYGAAKREQANAFLEEQTLSLTSSLWIVLKVYFRDAFTSKDNITRELFIDKVCMLQDMGVKFTAAEVPEEAPPEDVTKH